LHCGAPGTNTGCETAVDVNHCGGCNSMCGTAHATANSCGGSQCGYTCASGYADCVKLGTNTDGCETPINTAANCGGCNQACDTQHSVGASCNGTSCTYSSCAAGYLDCDQSGSNANGCECQSTMCCGTACQPNHQNGLGQNYLLMCIALGTPGNAATYTVEMATAARDAWNQAGTDGTQSCGNGGNAALCVNRSGTPMGCAVWCYTKGIAGRVLLAPTCTCPNNNSSSWN